jgi:transcriptional regulator with GAF, ATPase, and Fis domain
MDNFTSLNLVGRSPAFLAALESIAKFAACNATVLIQGETGTGKELAARAIPTQVLGVTVRLSLSIAAPCRTA